MYGKGIRDEFDHQSLSAMVDYWISPAAVKKEFEASRGKNVFLTIILLNDFVRVLMSWNLFSIVKYRLPSVFFSGNVRLPTLVQSLESLPANILGSPEACGLHSSPEVSKPLTTARIVVCTHSPFHVFY